MERTRDDILNDIRHQEVVAKYSRRQVDNKKSSDGLRDLFRDQVKSCQAEAKKLIAELSKLPKGKRNAKKHS